MDVALLSVAAGFLALSGMFGLVLERVRKDDAAHPWATFLAVSFSAFSVLAVLLVPSAILLAALLGIGHLYPEAVYHRTPGHLFASVFTVSLGLFVYEALVEGYSNGSFRYLGLPVLATGVAEGLLTSGSLLAVTGPMLRSVDVSWGAALVAGTMSAGVSSLLERRL